MGLDVLFENARIVDGTGAPWYRGAVGVEDGEIAVVTQQQTPDIAADTTIDADEKVLAPGFIDLHSHSDLELFSDPRLTPKTQQGITTEVLGQDGFSMAPLMGEGTPEEWQEHLVGLAGTLEQDWTWGDTTAYLDAIDENGIAPNLAMLVGHGTVRYNVMGMADRSPDSDELDRMVDMVTQSLENGAIGFSTGLVYSPQQNADTDEVQALAGALAPYGRPFVAHIRSEGRWIWDAFDEFIDIGAETEVPLHISHFKVSGRNQQGKSSQLLTLFDAARDRGVDITADQYPYDAGNTMLSAVLPPWVKGDGPQKLLEHIKDPEIRDRMKRDIEEWRIEGWENQPARTGWENIVVTNLSRPENEELGGMNLAEIAADRDEHPLDVACDLLISENLSVSIIVEAMDIDDVENIMTHEHVGIGTDGLFGAAPHPRTYGSYPRILGPYVREKKLLGLEEAIRKMTSLPARAMGLSRKGIIRPEMDADLVLFDAYNVEDRATFDQPTLAPKGIDDVMVDGTFVIRDGSYTDHLPGSTIRA